MFQNDLGLSGNAYNVPVVCDVGAYSILYIFARNFIDKYDKFNIACVEVIMEIRRPNCQEIFEADSRLL
jgi:hypothetical protein